MPRGPKLNYVDKSFTPRDNLGIENVATSIQSELCPVVNTVTPRAFYWPFMAWNYYDFYINSGIDEKTYEAFDEPFLKKNDYFFVLSNLLVQGSDQNNLVGKDNTSRDILDNQNGPYKYNRSYFVTRFGGMQYYNAGCLTLGFITDRSQDGTTEYKLPRLTEEVGKPLALAFEEVIKDTAYYKNYRLQKDPEVPKGALVEFGNTASLDLHGFDECKKLLKSALFKPVNNERLSNKNLIESAKYLKFIYKNHNIKDPNLSQMREVLFDYFSPRGIYNYCYADDLKQIIGSWEIVIGRQYFAIAIELIWKYMLIILDTPVTLKDWFENCINNSKWNIDISGNLGTYINDCNYSFQEREKMISQGYRGFKDVYYNIENGIKIILSVYNRFKERDDLDNTYFSYGDEVSFSKMFELVEAHKNKPIIDLIIYIMDNWIVKRHQMVAFNKLVAGRDGFHFELVDDIYIRKVIPEPDFQGIRLIQLMQVMKDLDMLEG